MALSQTYNSKWNFRFSMSIPLATDTNSDWAIGARTSLFVPEQARLYLAVPHRGDQQAEIRVYATEQ